MVKTLGFQQEFSSARFSQPQVLLLGLAHYAGGARSYLSESRAPATSPHRNSGCQLYITGVHRICIYIYTHVIHMCVYTVITNGFSSVYCACTILKSRGQRCPCHFLCQRSWVTCGKDIGQGRLIYVPAIVSTCFNC